MNPAHHAHMAPKHERPIPSWPEALSPILPPSYSIWNNIRVLLVFFKHQQAEFLRSSPAGLLRFEYVAMCFWHGSSSYCRSLRVCFLFLASRCHGSRYFLAPSCCIGYKRHWSLYISASKLSNLCTSITRRLHSGFPFRFSSPACSLFGQWFLLAYLPVRPGFSVHRLAKFQFRVPPSCDSCVRYLLPASHRIKEDC